MLPSLTQTINTLAFIGLYKFYSMRIQALNKQSMHKVINVWGLVTIVHFFERKQNKTVLHLHVSRKSSDVRQIGRRTPKLLSAKLEALPW